MRSPDQLSGSVNVRRYSPMGLYVVGAHRQIRRIADFVAEIARELLRCVGVNRMVVTLRLPYARHKDIRPVRSIEIRLIEVHAAATVKFCRRVEEPERPVRLAEQQIASAVLLAIVDCAVYRLFGRVIGNGIRARRFPPNLHDVAIAIRRRRHPCCRSIPFLSRKHPVYSMRNR